MENEMESGFVVFVSFIFKADKVPKSIKRAARRFQGHFGAF